MIRCHSKPTNSKKSLRFKNFQIVSDMDGIQPESGRQADRNQNGLNLLLTSFLCACGLFLLRLHCTCRCSLVRTYPQLTLATLTLLILFVLVLVVHLRNQIFNSYRQRANDTFAPGKSDTQREKI